MKVITEKYNSLGRMTLHELQVRLSNLLIHLLSNLLIHLLSNLLINL